MKYKSPLHEMAMTTPTQFWNDGCSIPDIQYAMEHGAVGATTNPLIVMQVLKKQWDTHLPIIEKMINENPGATEDEITWEVIEYMAKAGAKQLLPVFEKTRGSAGYISIQTNTKYYRCAEKLVAQALHFKTLAPNIMVKMPVTAAGINAIEEAIFEGVNVNATVSFTVSQALAVAEAMERGLNRREQAGRDNSTMHPVCTIMTGRIEDWLREVMAAQEIIVDPSAIDFSGIAVFKKTYRIYCERNYRARLLVAAYRSHYHWSQFIGGNISMTIPPNWLRQFANSDIECKNRINDAVDPLLVEQLRKHFVDFVRAIEPDGLKPEEFDTFGPACRTLMQFLKGYDDMVAMIRGLMTDRANVRANT